MNKADYTLELIARLAKIMLDGGDATSHRQELEFILDTAKSLKS